MDIEMKVQYRGCHRVDGSDHVSQCSLMMAFLMSV